MTRTIAAAAVWCCLVAAWAPPAVAQQTRPAPVRPQAQGVSPGEIQQLFDAMVLMQAQEALQLSDAQYPQFLTRLRSLQEARRRSDAERGRILQELRRLTQVDDPARRDQITTRLNRLHEIDAEAATATREAMDALDAILDVRQRALFRLFEEQMERRKVDLLTRARQQGVQPNRF